MAIQLNTVSETLLITLYIRSKDSFQKNSVLKDKKSAEILSQIDYDFTKFEKGKMSYYGVLSRAKVMDAQVRKFIAGHPDCTIISVGCGLDTRFSRVDNGKIHWVNLDFPEVIEQRKLFFEEHERVQNIGRSALDPQWPKEVKLCGEDLLIISEGVLMYLKESDVKKFLEAKLYN